MKIKEPRHISLDLTNYFNLSSVGTAAVVTRTVAITSIREFVVKIKARKCRIDFFPYTLDSTHYHQLFTWVNSDRTKETGFNLNHRITEL